MRDLLAGCRVVDLSVRLVPGQEERRLEIRRGVIPSDDTFMHEIDTMSHIGTHVEAPSHFFEDGADVTDLPLCSFMGPAHVLRLSSLAPNAPITSEVLDEASGGAVRQDDILIFTSGRPADEKPDLTPDAGHWMATRGVKMLGIDDTVSLGANTADVRELHDILMSRDVPFLEVIGNLDELQSDEFFLLALPLRIAGLDSSLVRCIAIEEE
ncbi:MAG: cyclase family protein [Armatimonadota bacterium]|jgi:arylformamidase